MAKAKKSASTSNSAPAAAAKKKAAPKKAAKAAKPAAPAGMPMIDTTLAAQAAAKMLAAGLNKSQEPASQDSAGPRQESAMFKQLKAGLNKPASSTMANLLEKSHGPDLTKSHQAFNKQVGHNQTYGADVTRSGVPRRTPG